MNGERLGTVENESALSITHSREAMIEATEAENYGAVTEQMAELVGSLSFLEPVEQEAITGSLGDLISKPGEFPKDEITAYVAEVCDELVKRAGGIADGVKLPEMEGENVFDAATLDREFPEGAE